MPVWLGALALSAGMTAVAAVNPDRRDPNYHHAHARPVLAARAHATLRTARSQATAHRVRKTSAR